MMAKFSERGIRQCDR